jgi:protein involved in ribonucleotide reduction
MDNDDAGKMNVDKFVQKLGASRTHIVTHNIKDFKDANDFLQKKPEMITELVKKARTLPDQNILQFDLIREKVKDRIMN